MKCLFSIIAAIVVSSGVMGQSPSLVVQKNTVPDANYGFSFSVTGPGAPAGSIGLTNGFMLNNVYEAYQAGDIGASSGGSVGYLVLTQQDNSNAVYKYNSGADGWTYMNHNALRVDQSNDGSIWSVRSDQNVYANAYSGWAWNNDYNAKDVGLGSDDNVYVIADGSNTGNSHLVGDVFKLSGGTFVDIWTDGYTAERVDGGPGGKAYWITTNNYIYQYNGTNAVQLPQIPGVQDLIDIGVGPNGKIWVIAQPTGTYYKKIYYYDAATSTWKADALAPIGTNIQNVTVGLDGEPLMTLNFSGGRNYLLKRLSDGRWIHINPQQQYFNDTRIYYNQTPGTYTITESSATGYYVQDITIFGSTQDQFNTLTGVTSFNLGATEHAFISYTNVNGTKPTPTTVSSACGSLGYVENFGSGTNGTVSQLSNGVTTYRFEGNPSGHYIGNGVNDGEYALTNSVYDATGYYYQWISGPGSIPSPLTNPTNNVHSNGSVRDTSDHDHSRIYDPTAQNGRMLLVNGDFGAGTFYRKEYTVSPNVQYQFSAWLANVLLPIATDATDPNVMLRVVEPSTGTVLLELETGDIPKSTNSTLDWNQYIGSFTPQSNTVAVYLTNNKPGGQGNDLVIDDIAFNVDCHSIAGTVYNDNDGLLDGIVDGGPITSVLRPTDAALYAVLVNKDGIVVQSQQITNGTYLFANLEGGSYTVQITTTPPPGNNQAALAITTNPDYVNTGNFYGDFNGTGTGLIDKNSALYSIAVDLGTRNIAKVDFGLNIGPSANDKMNNTISDPDGMTAPANLLVNTSHAFTEGSATYLEGADVNNGEIVHYTIKALPQFGHLYLNGVLVENLNQVDSLTPANVATLQYQTDGSLPNAIGSTQDQFTYVSVDNAGLSSAPATYVIPFAVALPVRLVSFKVAEKNCSAILSWRTGNEENFSHFVVEATNQGKFKSIGQVSAEGSNSSYSFIDKSTLLGSSNYRLKMVDLDGKFNYTKIVQLNRKCENQIAILPNITNSHSIITGLVGGEKVSISNSMGQLIETAIGTAGTHNLDLTNQAKGIYLITISDKSTKIFSGKVVKY